MFAQIICLAAGLSAALLPFSLRASTGLWRAMAADADAAAEAMAGMASGATATAQPAQKRKRGTALQAGQNKVTELSAALDVALAKEQQAKAKAEQQKTKAAVTAAEREAGKVVNVRAKLAVAEEDLQNKQTLATAAKNMAEAKAQKAAEKEETNRAMTEAGLICLVEIVAAALFPFPLLRLSLLLPLRGIRPAPLATCSGARSRPSSASSACGPGWVAANICVGSLPVVWWRMLTGTP